MKKVAIISSNEGILLESIVRYLKDTEFTCVTTNPNSKSLERAEYLGIKNTILENNNLQEFLDKEKFDLVVFEDIINEKFCGLKINPCLLPAFKNSENPIADAIIEGCKVTGVTILNNDKIIAQYPIFITQDMHFDDLENHINQIEQVLYPLVIEKVLNNEPFETQKLMKQNSCSSSCGGNCSNCKH